jgi:hypothetical protein
MTDDELFAMDPVDRAWAVLDITYRGRHHLPSGGRNVTVHRNGNWTYLEANVIAQLATFDYDELSRLVFAAHDYCVRVEIAQSGRGMVKLLLHPRNTREGSTMVRHPGLTDAYTAYKERGN